MQLPGNCKKKTILIPHKSSLAKIRRQCHIPDMEADQFITPEFRKHRRSYLSMLIIVCMLLSCTGCSREETPLEVDLSRRETVRRRQESEAVTYAYLPQYTHTESYERHHRLVEYLEAETGIQIRQIFPDTFAQHIQMVGEGKIDISFSNPVIYVNIARQYGARAFARAVEEGGRAMFRGQIISRRDNPEIATVSDCRGKRWIAVDPGSAGGYFFPLGYFLSHGIRRSGFREIAFAPGPGGKQEKVILSVYAGQYDIGTIREGALAVVADRIDTGDIRIVDTTPWYPGWVYAARDGLDGVIIEAVREALLRLDDGGPDRQAILENAELTGIIPARDQDYDPVRELLNRIGTWQPESEEAVHETGIPE